MALGQEVRPAYEVHPFHGKTTRTKCSFDAKTRSIVREEVADEGGFMVYFPKGHSIRVRSEAELSALGFDMPAKMVDMESGDEVESTALQRRSKAMTKQTRGRRNEEDDE